MWVEELSLENIKCFEKLTLKFNHDKSKPARWISLLGENGVGKSTILQSLGLLLAGPEGSPKLLSRPIGWLRNESVPGKLSIRIHQGPNDPGRFGEKKERRAFGYTFFITGSEKVNVRNKLFTEPTIVENKDKILTWLRQNALTSKQNGWFAAGYGAFRRLTRKSEIIIPSLQTPERFTYFLTQFNEDEPLAAMERWFVYLDYRIVKDRDSTAKRNKDLAIEAINHMLPDGNKFDSITSGGKILFDVKGKKVATIGLSDGFRSVLALAGDMVWRLLESYPESDSPLHEEGVVMIDELDIHLHPTWQRLIAGWLRNQFPNLQFIVATHSPLIVAGAGEDALTYRFTLADGKADAQKITGLPFLSVDKILQGEAFSLVSLFSPQAERKINRYLELKKKPRLTENEKEELQMVIPFAEEAYAEIPTKDSLDYKIQEFLKSKLR